MMSPILKGSCAAACVIGVSEAASRSAALARVRDAWPVFVIIGTSSVSGWQILILRSRAAASRRMKATGRGLMVRDALRAPHHEGLGRRPGSAGRERDCRRIVVARAHGARLEDAVLRDPFERLLVDVARIRLEHDTLARPPAPRVHDCVEAVGEFVLVV